MGLLDLFNKKSSPPAGETSDALTRFRLVQVKCPACAAPAEMKIYDTVDASEDGPAWVRIREARLNTLVCSCGKSISAVCPLLVHVPESQRIFFLAPGGLSESDQNTAADKLMFRLLARYEVPPTYVRNLEIVEVEGHEYEGFAAYINKNLRRPLI